MTPLPLEYNILEHLGFDESWNSDLRQGEITLTLPTGQLVYIVGYDGYESEEDDKRVWNPTNYRLSEIAVPQGNGKVFSQKFGAEDVYYFQYIHELQLILREHVGIDIAEDFDHYLRSKGLSAFMI